MLSRWRRNPGGRPDSRLSRAPNAGLRSHEPRRARTGRCRGRCSCKCFDKLALALGIAKREGLGGRNRGGEDEKDATGRGRGGRWILRARLRAYRIRTPSIIKKESDLRGQTSFPGSNDEDILNPLGERGRGSISRHSSSDRFLSHGHRLTLSFVPYRIILEDRKI